MKAEDEFEIKKYQLCEIDKFVGGLQATDEIAVEATRGTRWFYEQVAAAVSRVVLVNPRQFEVVRNSARENRQTRCDKFGKIFESRLIARSESEERSGGKGAKFS